MYKFVSVILLATAPFAANAGDFDSIDYSSLTGVDNSINTMIDSIPEGNKENFTRGLMILTTQAETKAQEAGGNLTEAQMVSLVKEMLSIHTIDSLISLGKRYPSDTSPLPRNVTPN